MTMYREIEKKTNKYYFEYYKTATLEDNTQN